MFHGREFFSFRINAMAAWGTFGPQQDENTQAKDQLTLYGSFRFHLPQSILANV
jgi:hypothetical protein